MIGPRSVRLNFRAISLAVSAVLFIGGCAQTPSVPAGAGHFSTVVIDAGHGGKDSGGVSGRRARIFLREKDLTLDTAKLVRDELRRAGLKIVMIREVVDSKLNPGPAEQGCILNCVIDGS